jgi:gelsolin
MRKQETLDIADTNLANFGSQLEKDVKLAAALSDPEWKAMHDRTPKVGFDVWRIEKFTVKKWPKEKFGHFHTGDSYILLRTYKKEDKFAYDIHFWLGTETTQDEAGTAAIKTVELDDSLGQVPVQHREVQEHESPQFLSYFKDKGGIRILQGGIESGFNKVKPTEYKPRLLHIKGKRNVRVTQVEMSWKSLNSGDVFVLDAGMKLWQWQGNKCSGQERIKAASLMTAIDDERGGKPVKFNIAEDDKDSDSEVKEFWDIVGGKGGEIAAADDLDDKWEEGFPAQLYRISDAKGSLKITHEGTGIIPKSKLDTKDVFLLDVGNEVFVWVGLKASAAEKKNAMGMAQTYLKVISILILLFVLI